MATSDWQFKHVVCGCCIAWRMLPLTLLQQSGWTIEVKWREGKPCGADCKAQQVIDEMRAVLADITEPAS